MQINTQDCLRSDCVLAGVNREGIRGCTFDLLKIPSSDSSKERSCVMHHKHGMEGPAHTSQKYPGPTGYYLVTYNHLNQTSKREAKDQCSGQYKY